MSVSRRDYTLSQCLLEIISKTTYLYYLLFGRQCIRRLDMNDVETRGTQPDIKNILDKLADKIRDYKRKFVITTVCCYVLGIVGGILTVAGLTLKQDSHLVPYALSITGGTIGAISQIGIILVILIDHIYTSEKSLSALRMLILRAFEVDCVKKQFPRVLAQFNGEEINDLKKRITGRIENNEGTTEGCFKKITALKTCFKDNALIVIPVLRAVRATFEVSEVITLILAYSKTGKGTVVMNGIAADSSTTSIVSQGTTLGTVADAGVDVMKTTLSEAKIFSLSFAVIGICGDLCWCMWYIFRREKTRNVVQNIKAAAIKVANAEAGCNV